MWFKKKKMTLEQGVQQHLKQVDAQCKMLDKLKEKVEKQYV